MKKNRVIKKKQTLEKGKIEYRYNDKKNKKMRKLYKEFIRKKYRSKCDSNCAKEGTKKKRIQRKGKQKKELN